MQKSIWHNATHIFGFKTLRKQRVEENILCWVKTTYKTIQLIPYANVIETLDIVPQRKLTYNSSCNKVRMPISPHIQHSN